MLCVIAKKMFEKIIKYQNESEKNFESIKNFRTIVNYIFAFILFLSSSVFAGLSFPLRYVYNKTFKRSFDSKILQLNEKNIEVILKKEKLILIDFWAEWCGPCIMMNSTIEKFAFESKNIRVAKVNADLNRRLLDKFQIKGLPQFILIKNGKEIKRFAGAMTISDLNKFCDENKK